MFTKVTTIFLVCQLALAFALPAVRTSIKGEENVQKLIDELGRSRPTQSQTGKNSVVKKTTTTTTIEEDSNNRFGTENKGRGNSAVSTSEKLLNELKSTNENIKESSSSSSRSEDWTRTNNKVENSEEFKQQAKNAHYQFATQINDLINGNYQQRAEVRQGGVLYGKYSYDDGYSWRTYYYQADSQGYRVTKEEILPTHMKEFTGEASVQTMVDGNLVDYHITEKDIVPSKRSNSNRQK